MHFGQQQITQMTGLKSLDLYVNRLSMRNGVASGSKEVAKVFSDALIGRLVLGMLVVRGLGRRQIESLSHEAERLRHVGWKGSMRRTNGV